MLHDFGPVADPFLSQMNAARALAHHGPAAQRPRHGRALCLSGGGFRAALFHAGAVRRLDELGVLGRLRTISAVSGGAIVANLLAHPQLQWPEPSGSPGRVGGLDDLVLEPLRRLTSRNLRTPALLARVRPRGWADPSASITTLTEVLLEIVPWWSRDLREPGREGPVILTGATEVGYGVGWTFADARSHGPRGLIGDHRLGYAAPPPGVRVVDAVVASCAHPPFLPPLEIDGRRLGLVGGVEDPYEDESVKAAIIRRVQLADGGVHDNLALEPVWSDHQVVLVSDGGAVFRGQPAGSLVGRLWRLLSIASSEGHTTRLRWLRSAFAAGLLDGATWSLGNVGPVSRVRTDLDAFTLAEQQVLEHHGYVMADTSLRTHSPQVIAQEHPLARPHIDLADVVQVARALAGSQRVTPLGRR